MKWSEIFIPTLKEAPRDADNVSIKLMIRAGMIRKIAAGLYDWLPLGLRSLKKVEHIVRDEMNAAGGQEVWLPHVQPKDLWEETGRWKIYGKELLRFKDRKGSEFCFAPTAEEVITDLVRKDVRSYRQIPLLLYQFGTKFRDEIRPRFGVMRAREFYMKDAYSFHASESDLEETYTRVFDAYVKIFTRCGFKFKPVEADTGTIGGNFSHEFMVLAETGEEEIVSCPVCGYAANVERAESVGLNLESNPPGTPQPVQEVPTPNVWKVEDVSKLIQVPGEKFIKTLFYMADGIPVVALIRGDTELNEAKLIRTLKTGAIEKMTEEHYTSLAQCEVGFAGPIGLKDRCGQKDPRTKIIADHLVKNIVNGVSGSNKKDFHLLNVNVGRDYEPDEYADLKKVKPGDACPACAKEAKKSILHFSRGIEVGHTFKLGTKYSDAMKAVYLDETGKSRPFIMGCYGIGISRIVAASIEQNYDETGIIWPSGIAPFQVEIVPVNFEEKKTHEATLKIYQELQSQGLEILLDNRPERAGIKFKDADLIGIPIRIILSEQGIEKGTAEVKVRSTGETLHIPLAQVPQKIKQTFEKP